MAASLARDSFSDNEKSNNSLSHRLPKPIGYGRPSSIRAAPDTSRYLDFLSTNWKIRLKRRPSDSALVHPADMFPYVPSGQYATEESVNLERARRAARER